MVKNVVVLGASQTGVPIAHHLLKHSVPLVPDMRVVLVSPNTDLFWNIASVRGVVPGKFGDDKLFYPIAHAFAKYPSDRFEHVLGRAEALDPDGKTVTVVLNDGVTRRAIEYHTVVVATGSRAREDMPWKNLSTTEETKAALATYRRRLAAAKTIVIAGAGETGSEVAGELGTAYGKTGQKRIVLVASDELPLGAHMKTEVRQAVRSELEAMKLRLILGARVTEVADAGTDGQKTVTVTHNGTGRTETIRADVYLPTAGIVPNTQFMPKRLLDRDGFINQTPQLRARGYDDVFVVGDAGNLESPTGLHADNQAIHVVKLLKARLTADANGRTNGAAGKDVEDTADYKANPKVVSAIVLGDRGTGQLGSWRLWSFLVWLLKGRHLGTDYAGDLAAGLRTMQVKDW